MLEKDGILGNTSGRRPGDVTIQKWAEGKGLALDVAVTSPLAPTYVRKEEPCEWYAATQKHGKYDANFEGNYYFFCAIIFELWVQSMLRTSSRFAIKCLDASYLLLREHEC